jgi:hypothetical protein
MTARPLTFDINDLSIASLRAAYVQGLTPLQLVEHLIGRMQVDSEQDSHHVWIHRLEANWLRDYARQLASKNPLTCRCMGFPLPSRTILIWQACQPQPRARTLRMYLLSLPRWCKS